ncbi:hypothetical protein REPUB_Repub19eG0051300 [Reevesia pubescens]
MGSSSTALNNSNDDDDSETETDEEIRNRYDTGPFRDGEIVLAYHNGQIYEAKILDFVKRFDGWQYYVHYRGWNEKWDEWVGIDRLMKVTEENRQKQEELKNKLKEEMRGTPRVPHFKLRNPKGGRGKKRKSDSIRKEKSAVSSEKVVSIQIPLSLKNQLMADCESITDLGKLVKLPRTPNVEDILKIYLDYRCKKDGMVTDSVREIFKGVCAYFNKALPLMLLYRSERQQCEHTITEDIRPSTVYGAEHLLRLFVKLPELLVCADIEEETLLELQQNLVDFLKCELLPFFCLLYAVAGARTPVLWEGPHPLSYAFKAHYSRITHLICYLPFGDIFLSSNSAYRSRCLFIAGSCRRIRMPYFSLRTMLQKMLRPAPINKIIKSQDMFAYYLYIHQRVVGSSFYLSTMLFHRLVKVLKLEISVLQNSLYL